MTNNNSHKAELEKQLWSVADSLRGHMSASEFQNYALGVIFYKYLSELLEIEVEAYLKNDNLTYKEAWKDEEYQEDLIDYLSQHMGYVIAPEHLYSSILDQIRKGSFGKWDIDLLQTAFNKLTESTIGNKSQQDFEGLFSDVNLQSPNLGKDLKSRSALMGEVVTKIGDINFRLGDTEIDVLGDAYEYMISQFASGAGKKGGEFYTPQSVSTILAKIVTSRDQKPESFYDPTCGSGSLLLRAARETQKDTARKHIVTLYGQELNTTTFNLARMNMILHGVSWKNFKIANGNTLTEDQFPDQKFDAIIANPPYSAQWNADSTLLKDERYAPYGKLAPSSKADYAFVVHMLHHLDTNGTMAVVLPHGVLFRGAAEGVIRKKIIDNNWLDAVIGLPANIFYGTSIPTCILVFKKDRKENEEILFVDASNEFDKGKNQNFLNETHLEKITDTYLNKEEVTKYSSLVSLKKIQENDYNLNIPRYVDSSVLEEDINLEEVFTLIENLNVEENKIQEKIKTYLKDLHLNYREQNQ